MLKIFETNEEYNNYIQSEPLLISGVLYYIKEDNSAHFSTNNIDGEYKIYDLGGGNQDDRLIAKLVTTMNNETEEIIGFGKKDLFESIEIDGEFIDLTQWTEWQRSYKFPTAGEHIIKYKFKDKTIISESALDGCSEISDIYIPNNFKIIGKRAFRYCIMESIILPDSIEELGIGAFSQCTKAKIIRLSSNIKTIGNEAFYNIRVNNLVIYKSIEYIGNLAFHTSPINVTFESKTPCNIGSDRVFETVNNIYVPAESVDIYKAATNWSTYADKIQAIP